MGCTGDGTAETQFAQVGRVGDEPNGAMLVIGAFGEEGSRRGPGMGL